MSKLSAQLKKSRRNQAMSKSPAQLKNNQAYLMYWTIVCALCVGVAACSTDALTGPKKGDAQITGEIEEESGGVEIIGATEE